MDLSSVAVGFGAVGAAAVAAIAGLDAPAQPVGTVPGMAAVATSAASSEAQNNSAGWEEALSKTEPSPNYVAVAAKGIGQYVTAQA